MKKDAGPNTFGFEAKPSPHEGQKRQHYRPMPIQMHQADTNSNPVTDWTSSTFCPGNSPE
jgi:hypothetical protein